jgi:hypothetical protein
VKALVLLFDVPVDPVSAVPWGALIFLLMVVFLLAGALTAGLVVLLIWHKRKKAKVSESPAVSPEVLS